MDYLKTKDWPAGRFGVEPSYLWEVLAPRFNSHSISLQSPEAFHYDVLHICQEARTIQDLHNGLVERQAKRLYEIKNSLGWITSNSGSCAELFKFEPQQHHAFLSVCLHPSLESIANFMAAFYPAELANKLPPPSPLSLTPTDSKDGFPVLGATSPRSERRDSDGSHTPPVIFDSMGWLPTNRLSPKKDPLNQHIERTKSPVARRRRTNPRSSLDHAKPATQYSSPVKRRHDKFIDNLAEVPKRVRKSSKLNNRIPAAHASTNQMTSRGHGIMTRARSKQAKQPNENLRQSNNVS